MTQQLAISDNSAAQLASSSASLKLEKTFSYEPLTADHAASLRKQAARIRDRMKTATKAMIKAVVETGRDLIAVKQNLDHGKFCEWVEAECGFSLRTAQNYMKAASRFEEAKCETISHLQLSTVYQLSAKTAPPELVAQVIERGVAGQPVSDREARGMLAEATFRKREAEREKKRTLAARRVSKRTLIKREAQKKAWEEEERKAEERSEATAVSIIEKLGPEGLRIVAPAFQGPDHYRVAFRLQEQIRNIIGKGNLEQEAP
jgi:hypothetical protein